MSSMIIINFLFLLVGISSAKIIPIVHEGFKICVEPEKSAGLFDFSDLEIFAESDEAVYMNGSLKFLKKATSPWRFKLFTEKFVRNQWNVEAFFREMPDLCKVIQSPTEPWYFITSKLEHKNCPFPAGLKLNFDKQSLTEWKFPLPFTMIGAWRLTLMSLHEDNKSECMQIYFDLVEE